MAFSNKFENLDCLFHIINKNELTYLSYFINNYFFNINKNYLYFSSYYYFNNINYFN